MPYLRTFERVVYSYNSPVSIKTLVESTVSVPTLTKKTDQADLRSA